jgi:SagB-type dehydrogenase family enzyme
MKCRRLACFFFAVAGIFMTDLAVSGEWKGDMLRLPEPRMQSPVSVEEALRRRRSIRNYSEDALTLAEVSQLLWSAQGEAGRHNGRTAPSAGALYPLEVYLVAGNVAELEVGVYKYLPKHHALVCHASGDKRIMLAAAAMLQEWLRKAPAVIVLAAVEARTTRKYGKRGIRYVHMEAGHAGQNVSLQAVTLGLATVTVGAFSDTRVKQALDMGDDEQPLYLMPIGRVE